LECAGVLPPTPYDDRKSSQAIVNGRVSEPPLRERVRKLMKLRGLQGYDKKERSYKICLG
jgi:hypothetical protein